MQFNFQETRQYLRESEFEDLFTQTLGWDNHSQILPVVVDETEYILTAIAQKRGMAVYECPQMTEEHPFPDYATRRKIQKQVARTSHENFIIYTDANKSMQIWQWVKRQQGKPDACREHRYQTWQSGDSLIQKLQNIAISLDEEEEITLFGVIERVGTAFYAEKVTKKFYDRFKKEHDAFLGFLNGIPDEEMQKWYVSVMLNRLMFIYFIQKKGFLNSDKDYLKTKLRETQRNNTDLYYKEFLCPLFFEGFAKPENERDDDISDILGTVPYLNGGIFQKHEIETRHGENIEIPDTAFEKLFTFFEQYQWHLDDRPLKNDNEINPDVLGYIFEKYINQKQMGAYYTKEDITEYISKNTIIPFLFDAARKSCKIAFEGDASVWKLLQEDPDRYIYDAVKKGIGIPLPENIAVGISDVSQRTDWNTLAPEEFALPTEIWREVVARRQRYETVRAKLADGEVNDINDLITYNLDIRQFAQDVLENCEGPELLRAFWKAITEVTVLDPTCGSGAFLFAALNILKPLYEACLDRMQVFLDELQHADIKPHPKKFSDFRDVLEDIKQHPNPDYFILKSIIIKNLYGVDIMDEAIEICKLRLFLKMVAQIEDVKQIEPLPDIDFNIQAGNTLVGFVTYDQVKEIVESKLKMDNTMERIEEKAEDIKVLFDRFREQQTELGGDVLPENKENLQSRLGILEDELNDYLARDYGIDPGKHVEYEKWLDSHKPFHWFIAFYGILQDGGFDVIIGNPPYVEYSEVKNEYKIRGYETESCGNLYAFTFERSFQLLHQNGWKSMIIPVSAYSTDRMAPLQNLFHELKQIGWVQTYDVFPSKLFIGAKQRLAIYIVQRSSKASPMLYATRYNKWHEQFRTYLFDMLEHADVSQAKFHNSVPKLHSDIEKNLWGKIVEHRVLDIDLAPRRSSNTIYFHNAPYYFMRAMDFAPYFWNEQDGERLSTQLKSLYLTSELDAAVVTAGLNTSLFYWWYVILSDCRHLNMREVKSFPIGLKEMGESIKESLSNLTTSLMQDLKHNAQRKETYYKTTGHVIYDEFYPRLSKHIIDKIDRVLAEHYGFTDEELDFIINYDIKYRKGLGN